MHELNTIGLHFPVKFRDTPKFENRNPSISVIVLVNENNEVFCSTPKSTAAGNITYTFWWSPTTMARFTIFFTGTCPLSFMDVLNTAHTRTCTRTAYTASRRRVCSQLTYLTIPSIPSRKRSSPHATSRRKVSKDQSHRKNAPSAFHSIYRLWGLPGAGWRKWREHFQHKGTSTPYCTSPASTLPTRSILDVIPTSSDKCVSFHIGLLRFLNSLQFLTAFLYALVQSLAADGKDKFSQTARHYPDSNLVVENGNYPYEYKKETILY